MNKLKISMSVVLSVSLFMLVACTHSVQEEPFPFKLIHEAFALKPFEKPEGWEVFFVGQQLQGISINLTEPEKSAFEEFPREVTIGFGKRADVNEIDLAEINEYEQRDPSVGYRTLYSVSYEQNYAMLDIMRWDKEQVDDKGLPLGVSLGFHGIQNPDNVTEIEFISNGKHVHGIKNSEDLSWICTWLAEDHSLLYILRIHGHISDLTEEQRSVEQIQTVVERLSKELE